MKAINSRILNTNDENSIRILGMLHNSFEIGFKSCHTVIPKKWLQEKNLTAEITGVCYNAGQIHRRKNLLFNEELEKTGFLVKSRVQTKEEQISYTVFGKRSVIFPLKNISGQVINLYAVCIKNNKTSFLNNDGIYPEYPGADTEELIITPTIIDAATILQAGAIKDKTAVISLFDGDLKPQHLNAIAILKQLKSLVWIQYNN